MRRWTSLDEQFGKRRKHILVAEPTCYHQRQALAAGLVNNGQDAELAPVMGAFLDEVIPLRSHSNDTMYRRNLGLLRPHMPGYSGRSRMQEPSLRHSRPRFC